MFTLKVVILWKIRNRRYCAWAYFVRWLFIFSAFRDQLHAVAEKKKNVVLEQLTQQKEENEMLAKTRKE